jgi:hypothetical protein
LSAPARTAVAAAKAAVATTTQAVETLRTIMMSSHLGTV